MKGNNLPFARFSHLMAAMASLMNVGNGAAFLGGRAAALEQLGGYKSRGKGRASKPARNLFKNAHGKRYPERSTRQMNWIHRRAQGGPGLDAQNQPRA